MELILAFAAGLLTLLNPCVLPVLPLAVASGLETGRTGPFALAAGMGLSFTLVGVVVSLLGPGIGLAPEAVTRAFSVLMVLFGLALLVPALNARFAFATAGIANAASQRLARQEGRTTVAQFLGGILLGAVWSPCIGPTLGGAIALASQGAELGRATAIMLAFSAGVSVVVVGLAFGARRLTAGGRQAMEVAARWSKPLTGAAFVLVGLATFFGVADVAIGGLLLLMPDWLQDFTVSI
ncbi:MAG: cytochrome c biogenesis protein CcdA [Rhizobiaceae bacterium]|nr:cytochrome c biogenesis protein CcdA [Parvibaculum sp.]MBX3568538.1 cytochrome c biogenesis protein CcdA [Rhizobiaceae bacterium]